MSVGGTPVSVGPASGGGGGVTHAPAALHDSPALQAPQLPPHPSSPHVLPVQLGLQSHPAPAAGRVALQSAQVASPMPSEPVVG